MSWLMYATRSTSRTIRPSMRLGLDLSGVREDPVADLPGQVQPSAIRSDCSLWRKPRPKRSRSTCRGPARPRGRTAGGRCRGRDRSLRSDPRSAQRAGNSARDRGRLERVRHAVPVMVAGGIDEDLCLPLEPAERLRVDDPVAVALERCPDLARRLGSNSSACLVRPNRDRRQPLLLALAYARSKESATSPSSLRNGPRVVARPLVDRVSKSNRARPRARRVPHPQPLPPGASGGASNATALHVTGV